MSKILSANVGDTKSEVTIASGSDSGKDCKFIMNDAVSRNEAIRTLKELLNRLTQETTPPTNT